MARESAYRVAIANANVPNMLGQISTAMANAGLNIHNMVNKSRGEMAYTLVDVDSAVGERGAATACARSTACCRCATCRITPELGGGMAKKRRAASGPAADAGTRLPAMPARAQRRGLWVAWARCWR